ncbi:MAG: hypothetical protein RL304_193, partial [Verrucomicrobiota bacterium]
MRLLLALLSGLGLAALIVLVAERVMAPAAAPVPVPAVAATARPFAAVEPRTAEAQWAQAREVAWPALMARAEAGDAAAQFHRGMVHLLGTFVPADGGVGGGFTLDVDVDRGFVGFDAGFDV